MAMKIFALFLAALIATAHTQGMIFILFFYLFLLLHYKKNNIFFHFFILCLYLLIFEGPSNAADIAGAGCSVSASTTPQQEESWMTGEGDWGSQYSVSVTNTGRCPVSTLELFFQLPSNSNIVSISSISLLLFSLCYHLPSPLDNLPSTLSPLPSTPSPRHSPLLSIFDLWPDRQLGSDGRSLVLLAEPL